MTRIKRFMSAILGCAMTLMVLCNSAVRAAEQYDKSVTYNFDTNTDVPAIFKRSGGGGAMKVEDGALKLTANAGQTENLTINISDWAGASRKKGILTYSFDYKPEIDGASTIIVVGTTSTASGHILAGLTKTRLMGYNGEKSQAVNEWLTIDDTNSPHRVTLTFDFEKELYTCSVGGKTVSHPFDYFADKTVEDVTYNCGKADKFILYLRTYYKENYSYYIDNFKAEYTERYVQENITRCVNFIDVINNNGTAEEFREALLDVSALVGSYGDYNTQIVSDDSLEAVAGIQKVLYDNAPYNTSEDKLDMVIPEIMEIIKTNMPMISINSAKTVDELEYSLDTYGGEYSVDVNFVDEYKDNEKKLFYEEVLNYRKENGDFALKDDIKKAIESARLSADSHTAFIKYKAAHALTLPRVFDEYKDIVEIDMSYIEGENINQTLFILKTMTVNSYMEIPEALKNAYEQAKNNKETFRDIYEYDVEQNFGPKVERESTVLPDEPYFTDMAGFDWAKEAVDYLYDKGVLSGKGERLFAPGDKITREEFVKIIVNAFDIKLSDKKSGLSDIDEDEWYAPYVNAAYSCGIVQGKSDGSFGVGEYITREDVAVILYRTANIKNIQLEVKSGEEFSDADKFSEYAKKPVGVLRYNKIINGVGENMFEPKNTTTRAEAAVMIYKLLGA